MSILESSLLSALNGDSTSTILSGNLPGVTTLGGGTTTSALFTIGKDKDGNNEIKPNRVLTTLGATTTSSTTLYLQSQTGLPAEYTQEANKIGWTKEQTEEVNKIRDLEEWFASLSEEEQNRLLTSMNEKEQELSHEENTVKKI